MLWGCVRQEMKSLEELYMNHNKLTTLSWTVFGMVRPDKLTLSLSGNPLLCNHGNTGSLCWIKKGDQHGWITWLSDNFKPECSDSNMAWETLSCPQLGMYEHQYISILSLMGRNIISSCLTLLPIQF